MTELRKAAQSLATTANEYILADSHGDDPVYEPLRTAIADVHAALAQPQEDPMVELHRLESRTQHNDSVSDGGTDPRAQPQAERCWCDEQKIGEPGVTCGDCPRDYPHLKERMQPQAEPTPYDQRRERRASLLANIAQQHCQCDGCGKTSSAGWALYCVECIEKKIAPALAPQPQAEPTGDWVLVRRLTSNEMEAALAAAPRTTARMLTYDEIVVANRSVNGDVVLVHGFIVAFADAVQRAFAQANRIEVRDE